MLKEIRIATIVNVPVHLTYLTRFSNLTDLMRLIKFVTLILLYTVSKIGVYSLLYMLTCLL